MESINFYNNEEKKEETPSSEETIKNPRSDQESADESVRRQVEGVVESDRAMTDGEIRCYIEEHKNFFESRSQIITLDDLLVLGETIPGLKDHIEETLIPHCIHYTETVAEFDVWVKQFSKGDMSPEDFEQKSNSRSNIHDSMITDFNIVIRTAREHLGDQDWMDKFEGREVYAKLALQLTAEKLLAKK